MVNAHMRRAPVVGVTVSLCLGISALMLNACGTRQSHLRQSSERVNTAAVVTPRPVTRPQVRPPPPAENVRQVALIEETARARNPQNQRTGQATLIDVSPPVVPFEASRGRRGWKINIGHGRPLATPAVVGGTVFVGGGFGSHEFYALDAQTGQKRWALRVSDDGPTAAVVNEGVVAFNTESCTLFVVDQQSGRMLWSRWLGDPLMSQPTIYDGKVFMAFPASGGHRLVAFELRTGRELWRVPIRADIISAPIAYGDSIYSSTFDGTVYRHRVSDGALAMESAYRATSAPFLYGDQILVSHREDQPNGPRTMSVMNQLVLIRLLLAQVESIGRLPTQSGYNFNDSVVQGSVTTPRPALRARPAQWLNSTVQQSSSYRSQQSSSDTAVGFANAPATARVSEAEANIGQGTVRGLWEYQGSRPVVANGRIFVTQGDTLAALDPESGQEYWSRPLRGVLAQHGGHLASPPSVAADRLYLATVTGDIVVISQSDGREVDTISIGAPMRFQPAIVGGKLYVGTATGEIVMVDLNDPQADGWSMWGGSPSHNGTQP